MSSRTIEIRLTIVIPAEVSSPRRVAQSRQAPSAPLKRMPALVEDDCVSSQSSHHSAARSLYAEFNRTEPIPPFDPATGSTYTFETNSTRMNRIRSLKADTATDISLTDWKRLSDFLANLTYYKGHTTPEHVVELFEQYETWVKALPEQEARHLNRYQRMARFLREL